MKVSPKDMPKILLLVVMIGACLLYIGSTLLNRPRDVVQKDAPANRIVSGAPTQVAALEPAVTDQQYVEQIEAWSKPPQAPLGDPNPFRMVLSQDILNAMRRDRSGSSTGGGPRPMESYIYSGGVNPFGDSLPNAITDFPMLTVTGVIVDEVSGSSFATIRVNDAVKFVKEGDPLGEDLVVKRVSQRGVQIRAAKEVAFIEVSKSYKPHGMAAQAPSASNRRGRRNR